MRDYGTATWEGGDAECDHSTGKKARNDGGVGGRNGPTSQAQDGGELYYRDLCGKCGARRIDNQIGLESSPEAYVAALVEVFREVRRVLHPSGVVFLNLGDSYNGSGGAGGDYSEGGLKEGQPKYPGRRVNGLKPKDLCMIPARVAIALQDDGWWLRQEIVWHKKSCMPESVQDRCTRAHEMVYMLAKNANYFYDAEAIAEPATTGTDLGILRTRQHNLDRNDYNRRQEAIDAGIDSRNGNPSGTRNKRSVWTLGPEQFQGAHFATMPTKLVEPCVLAGSKVGDTVLDPFCGSGTTGYVALRHHRRFIGIDLNESYISLAHRRIQQSQPLLFTLEA